MQQTGIRFQGYRDPSPSEVSGYTLLKDTGPARVPLSRLSASESDNQSWAPRSEFGFDTSKKKTLKAMILFDPDDSDQDEDNEGDNENGESNTEPVTATTVSMSQKDFEDA